MPGWRYNAAATLEFGGAWVTAGGGRDPTSADLTVALNGVVVDSPEVALSRHPDSEGVYNLVFSTEYWARPLTTGNPIVSFAAGTFVSPTLGPLSAFSQPVTLVDCKLPTVARAMLLRTTGYACAVGSITCPSNGIGRAVFVVEIYFSEPVFRADGSPVTEADLQIYTVGGVATVSSTYVVQSLGGARRRRLSGAVGTTKLSVAVELGSTANGLEKVQIRPVEGAVRDGSGTWVLSHDEKDVVTAAGNVLEPFSAQMSSSESLPNSPVTVIVPVATFGVVALLVCVICLWQSRRHRRNSTKVRVAPRGWVKFGSWARASGLKPDSRKPQPKRPRSKVAPPDALAIAKQYEWLRAKEPHVELTGRWIDTLADAAVDTLRGAQPACALPPGVLKTAHVVHSNLWGGVAPDDLEALRALGKLLRNGPSPLPESLLMAAASLDTSAAAAMGQFGEVEATIALQRVLASDYAVPKAVALGLGDVAQQPASIGYADEADAKLKEQLAGLLQQREWYAYALSAVRGHLPACRAAFAMADLTYPPVVSDTDAVALVLKIVEMHARLGGRQREAETRTHRVVEAPYQAWARARRRGGGISDLEAAPAVDEVTQVRMRHNNESVSICRWLQYMSQVVTVQSSGRHTQVQGVVSSYERRRAVHTRCRGPGSLALAQSNAPDRRVAVKTSRG